MSIISTLIAFVVALGVLIVFHELGHYAVARLCGVKVLRFSVGFGMPLWRRKFGVDQTEWALSAFPLGGYVKMLDEREGPVAPAELHRAFNRQTVGKRFAIVLAGPVANFLLAILLYWVLFIHGVPGLRPVVGTPVPDSPAAVAHVEAGDLIARVDGVDVPTWQDLRWVLLDQSLRKATVQVEVHAERGDIRFLRLDLSSIGADKIDADLMQAIGLTRYQPALKPVIGRLVAGGAGERDGLKEGDEIVELDGRAVPAWEDLVASISAAPDRALHFRILRGGTIQELTVTPESKQENGKTLGRIGAAPKIDEAAMKRLLTEVRYGPVEAIGRGIERTWEVSTFTLKMLGKMIVGQISLKNLSGPITIADYAGQSAQLGWLAYVSFLALISISLGVLNLMPVPLLDGGHLMYYVAEIVKGSPVSDRVMEVGQQVGMVLLFSLMAFALYNDINRLFGG
ncbi:MAG TPA: RIP metalloprotease RseP [Burkholderiales bacterium]|nr:RIP metalloprotease RseP [Burkholderiales bacterium]